jgi:hypothetical protein
MDDAVRFVGPLSSGPAFVEAGDRRLALLGRSIGASGSDWCSPIGHSDGWRRARSDLSLAGLWGVGTDGVGALAGVALGDVAGGRRGHPAVQPARGDAWPATSATSPSTHLPRTAPDLADSRERRIQRSRRSCRPTRITGPAALNVRRRTSLAAGAPRRGLGARRGELAALRLGDLDSRVLTIERGVSHGVLGSTKSSRSRRLSLAATTVALIHEHFDSWVERGRVPAGD